MKETGYNKPYKFLLGDHICNNQPCISWGRSLNLTYDELLKVIVNAGAARSLGLKSKVHKNAEQSIVFLPRHGFCREIQNYDPSKEIMLGNDNINNDMVIYITDSAYKSHFSRDFSSHDGDEITVPAKTRVFVDVKVNVRSSCKTKKVIVGKDDFKTCVDEALKNKFKEPLHCIPPWLSDINQCNGTYNGTLLEIYPNFSDDYIQTARETGRKTRVEANCRQFCNITTSTVKLRGTWNIDETASVYNGLAIISFDQQVFVTEKVIELYIFNIFVSSSHGRSVFQLFFQLEIT